MHAAFGARLLLQLQAARTWGEYGSMRKKLCALVLVLAAVLMPAAVSSGQPQEQDRPPAPKSDVRPEDRVDLNHATVAQLMKVPGITRTWAQRIIRFRPYRSKQDLVDEGILPGEVYRRIRDYVIAHRDKS